MGEGLETFTVHFSEQFHADVKDTLKDAVFEFMVNVCQIAIRIRNTFPRISGDCDFLLASFSFCWESVNAIQSFSL